MSIAEFEALVEETRACGPTEQCLIVETYCCPRAVNASLADVVRDANERLVDAEGQCLATCISADALDAACVAGQCTAGQCVWH